MNTHGTSDRNRILKLSGLTGGLTAAVIGLTVMTAGASTPADQEVDRAAEVAERAAAAESSVRTLRLDAAAGEAGDAATHHAEALLTAAQNFQPVEFPTVPDDWVSAGVDLDKAEEEDGRLVQVLDDGSKVTFTVDPEAQSYAESLLNRYPVPHGSLVLIDPPTGRVIAKADESRRDDQYTGLSRNAGPPSASVFKVISAAALLAETDMGPDTEICYHGGTRGLTQRNIVGDPNLDNRCNNIEGALARSINSLIAKQTYHHLTPQALEQWAENFGYNQEIPFDLPVEPSRAEFGDDPYENARAAAGFWHTHLSPLHGAMIGAALANDGTMMIPRIIERYESPDGDVLYEAEPEVFRQVMEPQMAQRLADMMTTTAETGTARNHFRNRRGFPSHKIRVSGKTGTLSDKDPFLRFTWFVGFGEHMELEDHPGVAVAGLVANEPRWHIRGPRVASMGLNYFLSLEEQRHQLHHRDAVAAE